MTTKVNNDMNITFFRSFVGLAVVCSVLSFGPRLIARPAASADLLAQAYTTLERADHDYQGHRVAAMKQVAAAAKLLGVSIRGDGKGHEKQGLSDDQLRRAQGLLQEARSRLNGKVLKHVNKAIQQISIALTKK
jgi:hypothetical protein